VKNTAVLLLLAIAVEGVASEVGAYNPQNADKASKTLAVAIADTGASSRWALQPQSYTMARKADVREFEMHVEGLNDRIDQELEAIFSKKLDALLLANE